MHNETVTTDLSWKLTNSQHLITGIKLHLTTGAAATNKKHAVKQSLYKQIFEKYKVICFTERFVLCMWRQMIELLALQSLKLRGGICLWKPTVDICIKAELHWPHVWFYLRLWWRLTRQWVVMQVFAPASLCMRVCVCKGFSKVDCWSVCTYSWEGMLTRRHKRPLSKPTSLFEDFTESCNRRCVNRMLNCSLPSL